MIDLISEITWFILGLLLGVIISRIVTNPYSKKGLIKEIKGGHN